MCRKEIPVGLILLIIVILLLVGALYRGHSQNRGLYPSWRLRVVLLILLVLMLMGYLPRVI